MRCTFASFTHFGEEREEDDDESHRGNEADEYRQCPLHVIVVGRSYVNPDKVSNYKPLPHVLSNIRLTSN